MTNIQIRQGVFIYWGIRAWSLLVYRNFARLHIIVSTFNQQLTLLYFLGYMRTSHDALYLHMGMVADGAVKACSYGFSFCKGRNFLNVLCWNRGIYIARLCLANYLITIQRLMLSVASLMLLQVVPNFIVNEKTRYITENLIKQNGMI